MKHKLVLVVALLGSSMLSGCTTTGGSDSMGASASSSTGSGSSSSYGTSSTSGLGAGADFSSLPLDTVSGQTGSKTIYFDFDSYQIKPEFQSVVAAHAAYLASHPTARVRLEGHADERGSREYNIGLGERRADAVATLFSAAGAADGQLETVSYGEEQPVAECHNESCWSQNRRAVIEYSAR
ncbi:MAG: peptidoglycan-associated lipoprotein Pal [Gammaproteobacteria bacterium]